MKLRGVTYDAGMVLGIQWRPVFDLVAVRRELQVIREDLHCNTVRICGRDIDRLTTAAGIALELGLDVWLSPAMWNKRTAVTVEYVREAAKAAELLRTQWPDRLVFCVASEATLFVKGIVPGSNVTKRPRDFFREFKTEKHVEPLNRFLAQCAEVARQSFHGPLSYASLPFEEVDWSLFDVVGVDHYRDARSKDHYLDVLAPLLESGKPVVITEFGMRSYEGAGTSGSLGFGVVDSKSQFLHSLPMVGKWFRPRLKPGLHVRDEALQARELLDTLNILEGAGVEGAFVSTFVDQIAPYDDDPRFDLDMSSLSLVKTFETGYGTTYPDMKWEPKESFRTVATFYEEHA